MSEAKPLASLSSGLLARKGSAQPAMRPQLYLSRDEHDFDDTGVQPQRGPTIITLRPHTVRSTTRTQPVKPRTSAKTKAAFTLRLDAERHLKLRSTSTRSHRSAQSLVTEALDRFLADLESGSN